MTDVTEQGVNKPDKIIFTDVAMKSGHIRQSAIRESRGRESKSCHKGHHHQTLECPQATQQTPTVTPSPQPPSTSLPIKPELLVFADTRLATVYPIIKKFKSIITSDPLNITKSWLGSDICRYRGFYCDNPPDNMSATVVASIDFNGFQLGAPTLDGFLDQLLDIALFHANSNYFSGSVPINLTKLPYLYELDLSNNQLTGPFPNAVLSMYGLTFLDLRFNAFSGPVPPQIFTENLDVLFINNNDLMLNLPDNIGMSHIRYLTLANNKINGPLTGGLFKALSFLSEVVLLNSQLTGCIPYEIGSLNETVVLDASNNRLTGMLPFSVGCLEKVEQLSFAGNLLFGMVPEVMCILPNLASLRLSDNYFIGVGPLCMLLIQRGVVDVKNNCIPGLPFQRSVKECADFFAAPKPNCPQMWSYTYIPCKLS
ncbi:hypothetical protein ACFE04_013758 [Oxalis oulophora]